MQHDDASATATLAGPTDITLHQAIFTSVYSRVAKGYRLIACSSGVRPDERQELVALCPSHGNLLDDGPEAEGFASLLLESGRHCLLLSRHAGEEYSGRGGQRVHTHALIFDPEAFRLFAFDAPRVAAAARRLIPGEWLQTPPSDLDALTLPAPRDHTARPAADAQALEHPLNPGESQTLESIASALFDTRPVILLDDPHPALTLCALLAALPAWQRATLTYSWGLRHTAARGVQLLIMSGTPAEVERARTGPATLVLTWPGKEASPARADAARSDIPAHVARAAIRSLEAQSEGAQPANQDEPRLATPFIRTRPPAPKQILRTPPPRPAQRPSRPAARPGVPASAPELAATLRRATEHSGEAASPPALASPLRAASPIGPAAPPASDRVACGPSTNIDAAAPGSAATQRAAGFEEWIEFCTAHWKCGDLAALRPISDALLRPLDPIVLRRIVRLCRALDQVATAEETQLEELEREYRGDGASDGLQGDLARRLLSSIESRLATLRPRPEDIAYGRPEPKGMYF